MPLDEVGTEGGLRVSETSVELDRTEHIASATGVLAAASAQQLPKQAHTAVRVDGVNGAQPNKRLELARTTNQDSSRRADFRVE